MPQLGYSSPILGVVSDDLRDLPAEPRYRQIHFCAVFAAAHPLQQQILQ
jgi:hypothetical protein